MFEEEMQDYMDITNGEYPMNYLGPEEQGRSIVKCSVLREVNLDYDNSTKINFFSCN